jgi:hypothetical protein
MKRAANSRGQARDPIFSILSHCCRRPLFCDLTLAKLRDVCTTRENVAGAIIQQLRWCAAIDGLFHNVGDTSLLHKVGDRAAGGK